jgi:hypothetical protein
LRQYVRTIRATLDPLETNWRQDQRLHRYQALPPPAPAAIAIAVTVLEVQAGLRPPHQLERLSHYSLWRACTHLPEPAGEGPLPIAPRPIAVTLRGLAPGLVDATVVVDFAGRPHALGLRLDGAPGFWQLVELDYPSGSRGISLPPNGQPPWVRESRLPRDQAVAEERSSPLEGSDHPPSAEERLLPGPGEDLGIELE